MKNIETKIHNTAEWNDDGDLLGLYIVEMIESGYEYKGDLKLDGEWFSVFYKDGVLHGFASCEDILLFLQEEL